METKHQYRRGGRVLGRTAVPAAGVAVLAPLWPGGLGDAGPVRVTGGASAEAFRAVNGAVAGWPSWTGTLFDVSADGLLVVLGLVLAWPGRRRARRNDPGRRRHRRRLRDRPRSRHRSGPEPEPPVRLRRRAGRRRVRAAYPGVALAVRLAMASTRPAPFRHHTVVTRQVAVAWPGGLWCGSSRCGSTVTARAASCSHSRAAVCMGSGPNRVIRTALAPIPRPRPT